MIRIVKIVAILLFALCSIDVLAQSEKVTDFETINKHASVMQKFKKSQRLKSVQLLKASDGFMYIEAYTIKEEGYSIMGIHWETGIYAYATIEGNLIRGKQSDKLLYFPAMEECLVETSSSSKKLHPKTRAVFIDENRIISPDGIDLLRENGINHRISIHTWNNELLKCGYVPISKNFQDNSTALFTIDGKQLCPFSHSQFRIIHDEEIDYCVAINKKDDIFYEGMFNLRNSSDSIPCVYHSISHHAASKYVQNDTSYWWVTKDKLSQPTKYSPANNDAITFRDEGEKLYLRSKYNEAIEYYKSVGIEKPWSKFFTGMSILQLCNNDIGGYYTVANEYDTPSTKISRSYNEQKWKSEHLSYDANQIKRRLELARSILQQYLNSGEVEENYKHEAEYELSSIEQSFKLLDKYEPAYKLKVAQIRQQDEEARRLAEQRAQERARIWGSVLNVFTTAISSSLNNGGNNAQSYSGQSYNVQSANSSSASPSSSYSSSSKSSEGHSQSEKLKAQNRVKELQRSIHEYERMLTNAESELAKAKASGSAFVGQWVESVNSHKKTIRQKQAEIDKLTREYGL